MPQTCVENNNNNNSSDEKKNPNRKNWNRCSFFSFPIRWGTIFIRVCHFTAVAVSRSRRRSLAMTCVLSCKSGAAAGWECGNVIRYTWSTHTPLVHVPEPCSVVRKGCKAKADKSIRLDWCSKDTKDDSDVTDSNRVLLVLNLLNHWLQVETLNSTIRVTFQCTLWIEFSLDEFKKWREADRFHSCCTWHVTDGKSIDGNALYEIKFCTLHKVSLHTVLLYFCIQSVRIIIAIFFW